MSEFIEKKFGASSREWLMDASKSLDGANDF